MGRRIEKMIHWGLILRYSVYVVIPLVLGFWLVEWLTGSATVDRLILSLSMALPLIAVCWLAYENFRPRRK